MKYDSRVLGSSVLTLRVQIPVPPEDLSVQVVRQAVLVTMQIPQGLVQSVDLHTQHTQAEGGVGDRCL